MRRRLITPRGVALALLVLAATSCTPASRDAEARAVDRSAMVLRAVTFVADPLQRAARAACELEEARIDDWQTADAAEDAQQDAQIRALHQRCDRVLEGFAQLRSAQLAAVDTIALYQQGSATIDEVTAALGAVDRTLTAACRVLEASGLPLLIGKGPADGC